MFKELQWRTHGNYQSWCFFHALITTEVPAKPITRKVKANNLESIIIIIDAFYWHHSLSSLLTCIISFTCHTNSVYILVLLLTQLKLRHRKIKWFSQDDWNCNWLSQNFPESNYAAHNELQKKMLMVHAWRTAPCDCKKTGFTLKRSAFLCWFCHWLSAHASPLKPCCDHFLLVKWQTFITWFLGLLLIPILPPAPPP